MLTYRKQEKRVLNEEQPFMYNACLGVKDNLEDMLRKGHCNSTKTYHLSLPCSMLHGSILPEEKQSEVPLLNSVIGLSEKKTKELLSGCSLPQRSPRHKQPFHSCILEVSVLLSVNKRKVKSIFCYLDQCFKSCLSFLNFSGLRLYRSGKHVCFLLFFFLIHRS